MKYMMVEGTLLNIDKINDKIMKEHKQYTQKAMDDGITLISGLKSDQSGGIFLMKVNSIEELTSYLQQEPFQKYGIQSYRFVEFDIHYANAMMGDFY